MTKWIASDSVDPKLPVSSGGVWGEGRLGSGKVGKYGKWWYIVPKAVCLLRLHQNLDEIILMILHHFLLKWYIHLLINS